MKRTRRRTKKYGSMIIKAKNQHRFRKESERERKFENSMLNRFSLPFFVFFFRLFISVDCRSGLQPRFALFGGKSCVEIWRMCSRQNTCKSLDLAFFFLFFFRSSCHDHLGVKYESLLLRVSFSSHCFLSLFRLSELEGHISTAPANFDWWKMPEETVAEEQPRETANGNEIYKKIKQAKSCSKQFLTGCCCFVWCEILFSLFLLSRRRKIEEFHLFFFLLISSSRSLVHCSTREHGGEWT